MTTRRCAGLLTVALLLCGCGGGSGGGVTSALIDTLPVGDDLKEAIQQIVDDEADEIDVATLVDNRTSYRDGLSRIDDAIDSLTDGAKDAVDVGDVLSFAVAPRTRTASARGAAGAGALLGRVTGGAAGFARNTHFEGGFMALAPDAAAGVLRYDLSPSSTLSATMGGAEGEAAQSVAALDYARSAGGALALGLRAGAVRESGAMTGFVEGRIARRMTENTALLGEIGIGRTRFGTPALDGTLVSMEARLGMAATDLGRVGDRLTVSAGMPMHGVHDDLTLRRAAGRDADGAMTYTVSEAGAGRAVPVEMRLDYALPLGEGITVGIDSALRRDAGGHVDGDLSFGARLAF